MVSKKIRAMCWATLFVAAGAGAADADLEEGQRLFVKECKICHGDGTTQEHGATPRIDATRLALAEALPQSDVPAFFAKDLPRATAARHRAADATLAFAPPFGPNLQGVYGRPAGSAPGFQYSSAFLKAMKEVVWDEASLNVWITSPQAWVPGVYMFYKQKDPEIRRKIILYLKSVAAQ